MRAVTSFPDFSVTHMQISDIFRNLPKWAANEYQNFSVASWRRGAWIDKRFEKWPKRSRADEGRAILMKSGALRRSIRSRHGRDWFEIFTVSPYAKIHNEGGKIEVTPAMRRYFWAMHNKAKKRRKTEEAEFWKNMAITKKTHFVIPKRKFMGESLLLERRVVAQVERGLALAFR